MLVKAQGFYVIYHVRKVHSRQIPNQMFLAFAKDFVIFEHDKNTFYWTS